MNSDINKRGEVVRAPDTPSHTPPGGEGWKEVLHLLKEQKDKMEKLVRALSVIQQGMLRNNPGFVEDSVNEATEVLNTHKCLLESGVKIQKKMESHPAMKKLGIFQRLRSVSLGDTPKNQAKREKRTAPSPPLEKTPKRGKGGTSPSYAAVATSQPPNKEGDWHVVTKDVSAFHKEFDRAAGERAEISALVSTRSLEIRDLDETVEKEEVVSALCWHWANQQGNAEVPDVSRQGR